MKRTVEWRLFLHSTIRRNSSIRFQDENIVIAATRNEKGIQFLKGDGKVGVPYKKTEEAKKT